MRKKIRTVLAHDILTIAEAAVLAGLAPGTIKTMVVRGNLAAVKKGKTWLLDKVDVVKTNRPDTRSQTE